ncbi:MAG: arginine--tRNA ligase [Rhizomicrobium sp.]
MTRLSADLSQKAGEAFAAEGLDRSHGQVQASDRPDLAQFQCNGALAAAKEARSNPRLIAGRIAERLKKDPEFAKVEIAGPGFINLDLSDEALNRRMAFPKRRAPPEGKTVLIDFGGPNVAKPMHVGHLRSSVIGDCLQRLYRANGWRVLSDIHLGDWGLQMGQLLSEMEARGLAPIYFDPGFAGPYPEQSPVTMEDLEELYPAASAACKQSPARLDRARQATVDLQEGRPGYRALWRHFVSVSEAGLKREFTQLGVTFDLWKGESSVHDLIAPMLAKLKEKGVAEMSEGALVIEVARKEDKKALPPLMLVKSDGGMLYGTTDMATIVERVRDHDPDLILYVVDHRQHAHFEQLFRAAAKAGITGKAQLEHLGFGTINGADGKPFKTRAGGVMKLYDLIAMAVVEAKARLAEQGLGGDYTVSEREAMARQIAIATIKFADLSNHRTTDYVFDLARFSRFEGKTGPYLQYAAVRIQSILKKAGGQGYVQAAPVIHSPEERDLVLQLLGMGDAMWAAEDRRAPNILCDYAFTLAQNFSRFYAAHHVLSEGDAVLRGQRLGLCAEVLEAMTASLHLLGIAIPQRM